MFPTQFSSVASCIAVLLLLLPTGAQAGDKIPEPQRLGQPRKNYNPTLLHRESITFSPDGKKLAWMHHQAEGENTEDGGLAVILWDFEKGYQTHEMRSTKPRSFARSPIRFTPNSKWIVFGVFQPIPTFTPKGDEQIEYRNNVLIWLVFSGRELDILPRFAGLDKDSWEAVAATPDGKAIVAVNPRGGRVWEIPEGKQTHQFEHAEAEKLVLSSDCKLFAGRQANGTVLVFDTTEGKEVAKLQGNGLPLEFSPDSKKLATWHGGKVCLWDVEGSKEIWAVPSKTPAEATWGPRVAFSPDGKWVAWNEGKRTIVADPATGKTLFTLSGERGPITFSPDSQRLAVACPDGTVLMWNLAGVKK